MIQKQIIDALNSIISQDYNNFEILICDDGSSDNTRDIINNYIKNNGRYVIKYIYQDNADQLNALITLIPYITGDYVYILHSDDLLYDNQVLSKMVHYMNDNKDVDSIIGDITLINKNNDVIGVQHVNEYINNERIIALQFLWLGRNLYVDMAFHRKNIFIKDVYNNYLLWNGPFWLDLDKNTILNVKKVDFSFFKYRVFEENYINNPGAKLNVINGEIRVVTRLMKNYTIPFYKFQYLMFRLFNKLKSNKLYRPLYLKKETKNKYNIVKFVLNKRFSDEEIQNNIYLKSLLLFYKNYSARSIKISLNNNNIYYGKDMRLFNKKILNNEVERFYKEIFDEMNKGFNQVIVKTLEDKEKMEKILNFLCIYDYVHVKVGRSKNKNEEEQQV